MARSGSLRALSTAIVVATIVECSAIFVILDIQDVPVSRLVANLERLVRENPQDVRLRVNLARTHMMAYALKSASLGASRDAEGPAHEPLKENVLPEIRGAADPAAQKDAAAHLAKAIARYEEAIQIDPAHPFARLGYAWALQQAGEREKAIAAYRTAIDTAWPQELKSIRLQGWQSVTEEAARFLIPLLDAQRDAKEIAALRDRIAKLQAMPRAITPIVVPLRDGVTADDLTNAAAGVAFDADGSGRRSRWTWVTADAGLLVHDPRRSGSVTSALQWFGNVTFWLFWDNGYEPLRALDDDGDSRLRGAELDGLAIWRDANGNGVSERGEVALIKAWRIIELSSQYEIDDEHPDRIAFAPAGVTFADGAVRPTYDVILHRR